MVAKILPNYTVPRQQIAISSQDGRHCGTTNSQVRQFIEWVQMLAKSCQWANAGILAIRTHNEDANKLTQHVFQEVGLTPVFHLDYKQPELYLAIVTNFEFNVFRRIESSIPFVYGTNNSCVLYVRQTLVIWKFMLIFL